MATQVQLRRGNTLQTSTFTGAVAEVTIDTDKETIVVHDGTTVGGYPLARESSVSSNAIFSQAAFNQANTGINNALSASSYANSAFTAANSAATIDFTNVSVPAGTYGNTTHYGVVTVAANGRVTSVSTFAVSDPSSLAFSIALG
jgi:hypothetical protein